MNKALAEKEINAMEAFGYALIEKAARLRLALGVSTSGAFKKRKRPGDLTEEQEAKIIARRKKYFQKKAAAAETTTA